MSAKKYLVIVESPEKSKNIHGFLGSNYKVIATKGHVRGSFSHTPAGA